MAVKNRQPKRGTSKGERKQGSGRPDRGRRTPGSERQARGDRSGRAFEQAKASAELPENLIVGRNPVTEALKSGREIEKVIIADGAEGSVKKIAGIAGERGIPVYYNDRTALDRLACGHPHQGVVCFASAYAYGEMEDIYAKAEASGEEPFVIILDNLEDPHNLGAIMRTAECAGAHGIIIPKRRSCGLTDVVAKSSAGAIEYMPCVKVVNVAQTIDALKEDGFWIAACDMDGETYYKQNLRGKIALVIGSEGFGISRLVKEKCDFVASIPMLGNINSLNASNAAAILMYEVRKQRDGK